MSRIKDNFIVYKKISKVITFLVAVERKVQLDESIR